MGRWPYSNRRTTDECKSITVQFLNKHHYFDGGIRRGGITWSRGDEQTGSISFTVSITKDSAYVRFQYTLIDTDTEKKSEFDYTAQLVHTPCHFGKYRWWFVCPLVINGQACNRRVGALYLGDGKYFGCRHCYDLIYKSSKESHKFDKLFKGIKATPKQIRDYFRDN